MTRSYTLLLAALVVSTANSQIIKTLVNRACAQAQVALGLSSLATCECSASFKVGTGVAGNIDCALAQSPCLVPPDFYCVEGDFGADFQYSRRSGTGFTSSINGCFDVASGFPPPLDKFADIPQLCIAVIPSPETLKFGSCKVTLGGAACSCTICDSGLDFKFDCSDVDIAKSPLLFVPGPNITTCIGLSLIAVPQNKTILGP